VATDKETTDASASEPAVVESAGAAPAAVLDVAKQGSNGAVVPKNKRPSKL
jgi:hypothetical protein